MTVKPGEVLNPTGYKSFGNERRGETPNVREVDFKSLANGMYDCKRANIHVKGLMKRGTHEQDHSYQIGTFNDWVDATALKPIAMLWIAEHMKSVTVAELELIPVRVEKNDTQEFTYFYTADFETLKLDVMLSGDL